MRSTSVRGKLAICQPKKSWPFGTRRASILDDETMRSAV
jgi:hypothetical protein